jgi:hypothetical protein
MFRGAAGMDSPTPRAHSDSMTDIMTNTRQPLAADPVQSRRIQRVLRRSSFCVVATTSTRGASHAAGVLYDYIDGALYVHTMRSSRKARNIAANSRIGIVIPTRRLPVGPPFNVQFQATAELIAMDSPHITSLLDHRHLRSISGHGALNEPDGSFIRIVPTGTIHTYGIGVRLRGVIRDPLHAGDRHIAWEA